MLELIGSQLEKQNEWEFWGWIVEYCSSTEASPAAPFEEDFTWNVEAEGQAHP